MSTSRRLIQNIFKTYHNQLVAQRLPLKNIKAIDSITHCQSKEMGASYYSCKEGHEAVEQVHSCRHRSCYLCSSKRKLQWIESQKSRLFNCGHFHVVFTLPSEYRVLWQYNESWFTKTFFKTCRDTLLTLMADERHHGALPGVLMALHTWGRQLNLHPHMHCLVTAGGLNKAGEW